MHTVTKLSFEENWGPTAPPSVGWATWGQRNCRAAHHSVVGQNGTHSDGIFKVRVAIETCVSLAFPERHPAADQDMPLS